MKLAELLNGATATQTLSINVQADDAYVPEQCTATVGCVRRCNFINRPKQPYPDDGGACISHVQFRQ